MFPTKEIVHGQVNRLVGLLAGRAVSDSLEYGFGVVARGIYQIPWYNGPVMHSHLIAEQ
jgi:hypothetical protein